MASFVAMAGSDHCENGTGQDRHHIQHLLCPDDCAPAVVPVAPQAPPPDPLPRPLYAETIVRPILNLNLEPEKAPPRA